MQPADPLIATFHTWMEVFMRRSTEDFFHYSKKSGLSMPQIGALFQIHKGTDSVSDLGVGLGITSAAASQMLERMVQFHLIVRTEDPQDRRVKKLFLTEKGHRALQETIEARERWLEDLVSILSDSEREQVMMALNTLIEKANLVKQNTPQAN